VGGGRGAVAASGSAVGQRVRRNAFRLGPLSIQYAYNV
jgi:hypothetical protein